MSNVHVDSTLRVTPATRIAAVVAAVYGVVLVALGVVLAADWAFHRGNVGHLHDPAAYRGVAFFILACVAGAVSLVTGSVRAWHGARGLAAIIPLGLVVVVGCIGEPIDIATGASVTSNVIGAVVICAAALPAMLLILPRGTTAADGSSATR
ncbi:hypothetical protein [Curtobacterium sp. ISL-83]|uniref:hypothetical protein n=1 Tax=Curtobacterium sp. ISL-83 TaxID=2819145 RepID=UPI001BEA7EA9|nr:hypothetical protein [Curtobacterium sp. ISL-83]MBT2501064.1 hypothetical protein [Curtobacterium sp. ISL-83]